MTSPHVPFIRWTAGTVQPPFSPAQQRRWIDRVQRFNYSARQLTARTRWLRYPASAALGFVHPMCHSVLPIERQHLSQLGFPLAYRRADAAARRPSCGMPTGEGDPLPSSARCGSDQPITHTSASRLVLDPGVQARKGRAKRIRRSMHVACPTMPAIGFMRRLYLGGFT